MASTLHDARYKRMVKALVAARSEAGLTQRDLAARLKRPPSYVAKAESVQRRLDLIEVMDWVAALGLKSTFIAHLVQEGQRRS